MLHIAGYIRVRQSMSERAWAGRPMRTPGRDDQVWDGGSANEEVGDREQRHPRQEKEAAVEQGQAQTEGARGQVEHPTRGERGEREAGHGQIRVPPSVSM